MVRVLMYNHFSNSMEQHMRELSEPMPYSEDGTLSVREFRGKSNSDVIWSSTRVMDAWNMTRLAWGRPIYVGYAFRRIGEGGHANQSQHYAGTALDVAQNLPVATRDRLRDLAEDLGVWTYVEPAYLTPTWIHFDARRGAPACVAGYPIMRERMKGVYVATLQDALSAVGISGIRIDGTFGPVTRRGVERFQRENGIVSDGVVGCYTWTLLTAMANGLWRG